MECEEQKKSSWCDLPWPCNTCEMIFHKEPDGNRICFGCFEKRTETESEDKEVKIC